MRQATHIACFLSFVLQWHVVRSWILEFFTQQGCATRSQLALPNPAGANGDDCRPISLDQGILFFKESRCNADGTGIPYFRSYKDAECT
eukprot:3713019-Amphidinium_carterae.1